ncbi:glycerol-3-phosphate dehydrogenase/oxidase [Kiritimatiellaeota bacterium B1221]|nr:glycerol-3-phosphate dehydrogenase/oxidase [Kiritimatiellaeota bacterium B1221]
MKRDLKRLAEESFDLCILGGGINGLATARDAVQRGLKVALVEQGDFGAATSSGSLKILHGGLRYLQHLDFSRMTESIRERNALMRMAPHLVDPLGFLVPTTPGFMSGKLALRAAMTANDVISWKRNCGLRDRAQHLPAGRILSPTEVKSRAPGLPMQDVTGGALFYDAVMRNSDRFTLSFALSASREGAALANRVRGKQFLVREGKIEALRVEDLESGDEFEIRACQFAAMTGPWRDLLPELFTDRLADRTVVKNAGLQLLTRRGVCPASGLAIPSEEVDPDAKLQRGGRHYFSLPWQGYMLWGTQDKIYKGEPEDWKIREADIEEFIAEINGGLPGFKLKREDVLMAFGGLRLCDAEERKEGSKVSRRYAINDHAEDMKLDNLISMDGIKYTACRIMGEKATDLIMSKLGRQGGSRTAATHLAGGDYETRAILEAEIRAAVPAEWTMETVHLLAESYGSDWPRVWKEGPSAALLSDGRTPAFLVTYAVENEMALHLEDVMLRRCPLGTFGRPEAGLVQEVAAMMAELLGWDEAKRAQELQAFWNYYSYE